MEKAGGSQPLSEEKAKILDHLREIAREHLEVEEDVEINMDTSLVEGLQLDSLTQVVLINELETAYFFEFELEDQERIQTIADLVDLIIERRNTEGE